MCSKPPVLTKNQHGSNYPLTSFGEAFVNFAAESQKRVMDVGAGFGVATLAALKKGAQVIAVDICEEHLAAINESTDVLLKCNLETMNAKFPHFDIPHESLGAVYFAYSLPFLTGAEVEEGVRKIYDWLAPGGHVFIVTFTPYLGLIKSFIPVYLEKKKKGNRWSGFINDFSLYCTESLVLENLPNQLLFMDTDDLKWVFEGNGFVIKKLRYFGEEEGETYHSAPLDGKERVGLIAYKRIKGK